MSDVSDEMLVRRKERKKEIPRRDFNLQTEGGSAREQSMGKIIREQEKKRGGGKHAVDFNRRNKTSRTPLLSLLLLLHLLRRKKNGLTMRLNDRAVDSTRLSIYVYILVLRETSIIRVVTPDIYIYMYIYACVYTCDLRGGRRGDEGGAGTLSRLSTDDAVRRFKNGSSRGVPKV